MRLTVAQAALVAALTVMAYSRGLELSPPHLTHDEIKFALQAKSIADSGRDLNGRWFPVYFVEPGFSVGRDPLCIYVTAAVVRVAGFSETSIRLASVILGGVSAGLMFILARQLFQRPLTAWMVAFLFATTPTFYIHSRLALSVVYPVPFVIGWLILAHRLLRQPTRGIAVTAGVTLGAGIYSYLAAALMMPLYLLLTAALLVRRGERETAAIVIGAFLLTLLPVAAWQVMEPDRYRNIVSAYRLFESDPTPANATPAAPAASSLSLVRARIDVYWAAFAPSRLFFTGESSLQISTREVGSFLTTTAILLVLGVVALIRSPALPIRPILLIGLLTAPLPAVIMADVEIRRWLVFVPFVTIIAGYGVERVLAIVSRASAGRPSRNSAHGSAPRAMPTAAVAALVVVLALQFAGFTRDYFGPYRERASAWFGGNIRAALVSVLEEGQEQPPQAVYISSNIPWVEAYWRFYTAVAGREDWRERTRYVRSTDEPTPAVSPGAVMLTAASEPALPRLREAGWATERVVPDLDGRPSVIVLRPAE